MSKLKNFLTEYTFRRIDKVIYVRNPVSFMTIARNPIVDPFRLFNNRDTLVELLCFCEWVHPTETINQVDSLSTHLINWRPLGIIR